MSPRPTRTAQEQAAFLQGGGSAFPGPPLLRLSIPDLCPPPPSSLLAQLPPAAQGAPSSQPPSRLRQRGWEAGTHRPRRPRTRTRRASSRATAQPSPATTPPRPPRDARSAASQLRTLWSSDGRRHYLRTSPTLHDPPHIPRDRVHRAHVGPQNSNLEGPHAGTERAAAEPRAEPRPPGPTSCLRIGPRARQSPPMGPAGPPPGPPGSRIPPSLYVTSVPAGSGTGRSAAAHLSWHCLGETRRRGGPGRS